MLQSEKDALMIEAEAERRAAMLRDAAGVESSSEDQVASQMTQIMAGVPLVDALLDPLNYITFPDKPTAQRQPVDREIGQSDGSSN